MDILLLVLRNLILVYLRGLVALLAALFYFCIAEVIEKRIEK